MAKAAWGQTPALVQTWGEVPLSVGTWGEVGTPATDQKTDAPEAHDQVEIDTGEASS